MHTISYVCSNIIRHREVQRISTNTRKEPSQNPQLKKLVYHICWLIWSLVHICILCAGQTQCCLNRHKVYKLWLGSSDKRWYRLSIWHIILVTYRYKCVSTIQLWWQGRKDALQHNIWCGSYSVRSVSRILIMLLHM